MAKTHDSCPAHLCNDIYEDPSIWVEWRGPNFMHRVCTVTTRDLCRTCKWGLYSELGGRCGNLNRVEI